MPDEVQRLRRVIPPPHETQLELSLGVRSRLERGRHAVPRDSSVVDEDVLVGDAPGGVCMPARAGHRSMSGDEASATEAPWTAGMRCRRGPVPVVQLAGSMHLSDGD